MIQPARDAIRWQPVPRRIIFEAQWIARRLDPIDGTAWERIRDAAELAAWEAAWADGATRGIFRPSLLDLDSITFLAAREAGHIAAGAVLTRSAEVVGVSNLFARPGLDPWTGCLASAAAMFPGATLVGYESGPDLAAALAHGFETVGPLKVWMRD